MSHIQKIPALYQVALWSGYNMTLAIHSARGHFSERQFRIVERPNQHGQVETGHYHHTIEVGKLASNIRRYCVAAADED